MENTVRIGASASPPVPELGRLKAAAERVARANNNVDNFIARFHGPRGGEVATASTNPPDHYRNDLDTLFAQIDRLEEVVAVLDSIG